MPNQLLIALGLGLVAAVAFVSASTGPLPIRFLLFLVSPLPLFLAGLGWGTTAALAAGAAGTALAAIAGLPPALVFAASQAAPAALLTRLAMLRRETPAAGDAAVAIQWFPIGRIVVWTALLAAVPALLWLLTFGTDLEALRTELQRALDVAITAEFPQGPQGKPLGKEEMSALTEIIMALLPAASSIAWMAALLLNLWVAGRIMLASGQLERPWPDLAAIEFPTGTSLALAAAVAMSFLPGTTGRALSGFAGTFFVAYVLMGLAVVHFVTRGMAWRPFLLWAMYLLLLVVNAWVALPIAILGLAESFMHFRRRAPQGAGGGTT